MEKKILTNQEITSIRNRVRKIILTSKNKIGIPFNYVVVGSLKKGKEVSVNENGKYDIDIDITTKSSQKNAHSIYMEFKKAFNLRNDEKFIKKNRVIRVEKDDHFYMDIAIIDPSVKPKKIIVKSKDGKYEWNNI